MKASSGPRYVVGCRSKVDKEKLKAGTRLVLDMTTLTIMRILPREVSVVLHDTVSLSILIITKTTVFSISVFYWLAFYILAPSFLLYCVFTLVFLCHTTKQRWDANSSYNLLCTSCSRLILLCITCFMKTLVMLVTPLLVAYLIRYENWGSPLSCPLWILNCF